LFAIFEKAELLDQIPYLFCETSAKADFHFVKTDLDEADHVIVGLDPAVVEIADELHACAASHVAQHDPAGAPLLHICRQHRTEYRGPDLTKHTNRIMHLGGKYYLDNIIAGWAQTDASK
jgi:hypothetical protein